MTTWEDVHARYPELSNLADANFIPYWDDFYDSPEDLLAYFKHQPYDISPVIAELDDILASPMSEGELETMWLKGMGAYYEPTFGGRTYRQWFTELRRFFAE